MFHEAHRGSEDHDHIYGESIQTTSRMYAPFRLQSAQSLFSGRFTSSLSVRAFLSAVALSSLNIVGANRWQADSATVLLRFT